MTGHRFTADLVADSALEWMTRASMNHASADYAAPSSWVLPGEPVGGRFGMAALAIGVLDPASADPGESPFIVSAIGAAVGFVSGAGFALALSIADPQKQAAHSPVTHGLVCGAIGGAVLPLVTSMPDGNAVLTSLPGAAFGTAVIGLCHRCGSSHDHAALAFAVGQARTLVEAIAGTPPA
jgi:hypothetical protein